MHQILFWHQLAFRNIAGLREFHIDFTYETIKLDLYFIQLMVAICNAEDTTLEPSIEATYL